MPDQRAVYQDDCLHQHLHAGQPGHLGQGGGLRLPLRDDPRIREPGVHLDDAGELRRDAVISVLKFLHQDYDEYTIY